MEAILSLFVSDTLLYVGRPGLSARNQLELIKQTNHHIKEQRLEFSLCVYKQLIVEEGAEKAQ